MHAIIKLARMTPINEHLALVDFDRLLRLSYHDRTDASRAFRMKILELGYSKMSESEFVSLSAASQGALFDFDSMTDDQFIGFLQSGLDAWQPR